MPILCAFALGTTVHAQQSPGDAPVYKLPSRGAPASRIGGGTRGLALQDSPTVTVLAPNHTGLTTNPQPTLYWFLSKDAPVRIEMTLLDDAGVTPLIEKVVKTPMARGIHGLSLKDAGVTLAPDQEYRWHVALVFDPKMRSSDVTSSGTIKRVAASDTLKAQLATGTPASPAVYAAEGLWYDSIDVLVQRIDAAPDDKTLRDQLDSMLSQGGLKQVAGQR